MLRDLSSAPTDELSTTLTALLESGTDSNPALSALLHDYTAYHVVLVVVAGLFLGATSWLAVVLWLRYRRARRISGGAAGFERRTYLGFALASAVVALFLAVVVAANVSNALDPRHGFAEALGLIGTPKPGSSAGELQTAYTRWLTSGVDDAPARVTAAIEDRLSWQRPKAFITSALLAGGALLTASIWRRLVRRSRQRTGRRTWGERVVVASGVVLAGVCSLLMLMVIGNTQGSLAPLSLTLFYG